MSQVFEILSISFIHSIIEEKEKQQETRKKNFVSFCRNRIVLTTKNLHLSTKIDLIECLKVRKKMIEFNWQATRTHTNTYTRSFNQNVERKQKPAHTYAMTIPVHVSHSIRLKWFEFGYYMVVLFY